MKKDKFILGYKNQKYVFGHLDESEFCIEPISKSKIKKDLDNFNVVDEVIIYKLVPYAITKKGIVI